MYNYLSPALPPGTTPGYCLRLYKYELQNESSSITVWMVDGFDKRDGNTHAVYVVSVGALPLLYN